MSKTSDSTEQKPYYLVQTLERALLLLNEFILEQRPLSISELTQRSGLHKSIVHRLVATLCHYHYLEKELDGTHYRIGYKAFQLGAAFMNTTSLIESSREHLTRLVNETGFDVHLAVLDHGSVLYILNLEPARSARKYTSFGKRMMLHFTALGKCLTAWRNEKDVLDILEQEGMPARTEATITDPTAFLQELKKVRKLQYAIDDEESQKGSRCLAAPVFDYTGELVAAISMSTTTTSLPYSRLNEMADKVKTCGRLISNRLGYIQDD